ncbi:MAG TPA: DUF2752 domain-containing protein [Gemmataceae bacterium]|nr:DUF2752 domain-containing protein [Gemmataceae bacterium]
MQEPLTAQPAEPTPSAQAIPASPPQVIAQRRYWMGEFIRGRTCRWCLLAAVYVILQPPVDGLGKWGIPDLCTLHRYTGAPCPGCGMTRSGANLVRGNFGAAFNYHPLGFILHPILFGLAVLSVLPYSVRDAVAKGISRRARWLRRAETAFLIVFLIFGVVRFALVFSKLMSFPGKWF